jgi:hypothetical protein
MSKYALTIVALIGLTGCTRTERAEMREETRARTEEARAAADAQRREWEADIDRRLARIDRAMEEEKLKAEGRKMDAKAKREYDERMADLRRLREETREKYVSAKNATADGWDRFKNEMGQAMDKMEQSWDGFVADIRD